MTLGGDAGHEPLLPAAPARGYGAAQPVDGEAAREAGAQKEAPQAAEASVPLRAGSAPVNPAADAAGPSAGGASAAARRAQSAVLLRSPRVLRCCADSATDPRAAAGSAASERSVSKSDPRGAFWARISKMWRGPVVDSMTYKADVLTSWTSLFQLQGVRTAFNSPTVWKTMGRLLLLSIVCALVLLILLPNPAKLRTSKFQKIAVFLRIFVGLLLGFFLSTSVNRWFECTQGFLELYDSIRCLQVQLLALGVPVEQREKVLRYATVSGWLLGMTLQIEALSCEQEKEHASEEMFDSLRIDPESASDTESDPLCTAHRFNVLEDREISVVRRMADPASMMWVWVASYIGRMAMDGWIPPMQSPTYGLIMVCVEKAQNAIRSVRQSVLVQAPFIYVHLLASLVHVNNIVNAISFGIVLGSCIGTTLQYHGASGIYLADSGETDLVSDVENLIISFFICVVGPFLYQVLLEVCICISQPFASEESQIPTDRLMQRLQTDLTDARKMAASLPSWEAPTFRGSADAAAAKAAGAADA